MPPQTIDEVLVELDQIILRARQDQSRLGYFATLYRNVTIKVKEGIAAGFFEDGARMEQLDVTFANRYLLALQSFRAGHPASKCWVTAFQTARYLGTDRSSATTGRDECTHKSRFGHRRANCRSGKRVACASN